MAPIPSNQPPSSLPPDLVAFTLAHIAPPSSYFTTHLISTSLAQRHHYLALSPEEPSFVVWDSIHAPDIARALADLAHNPDHLPLPDVRYFADADSLAAYATIGDELFLVFLYHQDPLFPWKYHDARHLPLPSASHESFDAALAVAAALPSMDPACQESPDSFWDGYNSSEPSSSPRPAPVDVSESGDEKAEREYWARYSTNGTADSAIPSPHPEKQPPEVVASRRVLSDDITLLQQAPSHQQIVNRLKALGVEDENNSLPISMTIRGLDDAETKATEDAVRGLYCMWQTHNPSRPKSAFMAIVHRALS